ncbi:MAG: hypothetical protein EOO88_23330 [Pedobacter sp.]|nr:MAG: hypothetical protein EOO88_23330 [Pedobacter sp.]
MKKIAGIVLLAVLTACQPGADYKAVRKDVMKFHDVVMADHGIIISNQMKLDTLLTDIKALKQAFPEIDTLKERAAMTALKLELVKAEEVMNNWMHQFEPDVTGKSNEEAVKYFEAEKKKIIGIDSIYKQEIKLSRDYLLKFKK